MRPTFKETVEAVSKVFSSVRSVNAYTHTVTASVDREAWMALHTLNHKHDIENQRGQTLPELAVHTLLSFEKGSRDADDVALALEMRANYIETKDHLLSARDLSERGRVAPVITSDQQQLILRLRGIAAQLRK